MEGEAQTNTEAESTLLTADKIEDVVEGQGGEASLDDKAGDGDESGKVAPRAPETYELAMPEGVTLDSDLWAKAEPIVRAADLTNDQANKLAGFIASERKAESEAYQQEVAGWLNAVKQDPEMGGAKLAETAQQGVYALGKYGTPGLKKLLNETGYGNHPEFVRFFANVGKATPREDTVVEGEPSGSAPRSLEERLYGNKP